MRARGRLFENRSKKRRRRRSYLPRVHIHSLYFLPFSGRPHAHKFPISLFLPAAKPAGHRTESVVLLVVVLVVLVVGVSLSPARFLTEVHSKKTVLETETELPDISSTSWQLFTFFQHSLF